MVTQTKTSCHIFARIILLKNLTEWGGKPFFIHGTNHRKGVITLINPFVNFKVENLIADKHTKNPSGTQGKTVTNN